MFEAKTSILKSLLQLFHVNNRRIHFPNGVLFLTFHLDAVQCELHTRVVDLFAHRRAQFIPHIVIFHWLRQHHDDGRAAVEVDVKNRCAAGDNRANSNCDQDARNDCGQFAFADEIDLGGAEDSHHGQFGQPPLPFEYVEYDAGAEDRGKHAHHDA